MTTADEITLRVETRLERILQKHDREREKWFAVQKYNFGVLGIKRFGTMDRQKVKRKITMNEIMLSDLKRYPIEE